MKKIKQLLLSSALIGLPSVMCAKVYDFKAMGLSELPTQFEYLFEEGALERMNGVNHRWHLPKFSGNESDARLVFDIRMPEKSGAMLFYLGSGQSMGPRLTIESNGHVYLRRCGDIKEGERTGWLPVEYTPGDLIRYQLAMDLTDTTDGKQGSMTLTAQNLTTGGGSKAYDGMADVSLGFEPERHKVESWKRLEFKFHGDGEGRSFERFEIFTSDQAEVDLAKRNAAWQAMQIPKPRRALNQREFSFQKTCEEYGIEFPSKFSFCDSPAYRWEDAMASGNGLVGVLQDGDPLEEVFVFNSHKLINPAIGPYVPLPDMTDQLDKLRDGMLTGNFGKSWHDWVDVLWERTGHKKMLWAQSFHCGHRLRFNVYPDGQTSYGDLKDYLRVNNYENGEIIVKWTDDSGDWVRRTFTSRVEGQDVVVSQLEAPRGADLDFVLTLDKADAGRGDHNVFVDGDYMNVRVKYSPANGGHGGFEGVTRVITDAGEKIPTKNGMRIKGARKVLLLSKLDRYKDDFNEWDKQQLQKDLAELTPDYDALLNPHAAVHSEMFNRVNFTLWSPERERYLSNERLMDLEMADRTQINKTLMERVFYSSRYLFMASAGSQYAPRLTGMFSGSWATGWGGDYTCDANVNFAVLGGNTMALPEGMEGYFAIIERTVHQWRETARQFWGARGLSGPLRIDGEAAAPLHLNHLYSHNNGAGMGPWLLAPMYEHYEVTGDKEFLKERLYPLLVEQALFYEDFLTRKDEKGKYIFVPSYSPENYKGRQGQPHTMASINSTFDIACAKHTLHMVMHAHRDLGLPEGEQTAKWKDLLSKMPDYLINDEGALAEWSWPGYGESYGHRHSSHMYVVWPSYEINPENPDTAHLVENVRTALDKRGLHITSGHDALMKSIARIRVKQSGEIYKTFKYMLENKYFYNSLTGSHDYRHRIYNYDVILCWQGLVGETAVFTKGDLVELLPAMPEAFDSGMVRGVKGRNQLTVDALKWDLNKGEINCRLISDIDQEITLMHRKGISSIQSDDAQLKRSNLGSHARKLTLKASVPATITIQIPK